MAGNKFSLLVLAGLFFASIAGSTPFQYAAYHQVQTGGNVMAIWDVINRDSTDAPPEMVAGQDYFYAQNHYFYVHGRIEALTHKIIELEKKIEKLEQSFIRLESAYSDGFH